MSRERNGGFMSVRSDSVCVTLTVSLLAQPSMRTFGETKLPPTSAMILADHLAMHIRQPTIHAVVAIGQLVAPPLPSTGRGVRWLTARLPRRVLKTASSSLFLLASFSVFSAARNKTAGRAPSPLNGERAGVRGEMAHGAPLGNSSSKPERTPKHNARGEQQSQQLKAENNQDAVLRWTDPIVIHLCVQKITADLHRR